MRIAQVAPLYESVPPRCYGGTERVVSSTRMDINILRREGDVTVIAIK